MPMVEVSNGGTTCYSVCGAAQNSIHLQMYVYENGDLVSMQATGWGATQTLSYAGVTVVFTTSGFDITGFVGDVYTCVNNQPHLYTTISNPTITTHIPIDSWTQPYGISLISN